MKKLLIATVVSAFAFAAHAQTPAQPQKLPTSAQWLVSQLAEKDAAIVSLLDRVKSLESELEKAKSAPSEAKPTDKK